MLSRVLVIAALLVGAFDLFAQQRFDPEKEIRTTAAQELEAVIVEAKDFDNKTALVTIRSRAAMLLSFSDPGRSEAMFLEVWKYINGQTDADFDKPGAKLIVLKYLFPRNPKLARSLMAEKPKAESSSTPSDTTGRADDQRQAGKLAMQLVDVDPATAASLLEKSLLASATPGDIGALSRLREKDSFLSDYVAAKTLDALPTQPTLVSLPTLQILTAYVFPGPETTMVSSETESSLESLQFKYFVTAYEVLKISLRETNEALLKLSYAQRDLQYRAASQGIVASILAALAPRFQPMLAAELAETAGKLASQIPPGLSLMTRFGTTKLSGNPLTSNDPEEKFLYGLSSGDYDEARNQLERINDEKKRPLYTQLLLKTEARTLLGKADVMGALTLIRKLDEPTTRLVMYLDALRAAKRKRDGDLTRIVINEARLVIPQTDRNGLHVLALLSFVGQLTGPDTGDDAFEFLNNAIISINALAKKPKPEGVTRTPAEMAMAEINNPYSLIESTEMEQAFSSVGLRDLDRGLAHARRIDLRPLQLIARLETIQGIIKQPVSKPKTSAKPVAP